MYSIPYKNSLFEKQVSLIHLHKNNLLRKKINLKVDFI